VVFVDSDTYISAIRSFFSLLAVRVLEILIVRNDNMVIGKYQYRQQQAQQQASKQANKNNDMIRFESNKPVFNV
jgi:hypothetical protein